MKSESKFEGQLELSRARHSAAVLGSSGGASWKVMGLAGTEVVWVAPMKTETSASKY